MALHQRAPVRSIIGRVRRSRRANSWGGVFEAQRTHRLWKARAADNRLVPPHAAYGAGGRAHGKVPEHSTPPPGRSYSKGGRRKRTRPEVIGRRAKLVVEIGLRAGEGLRNSFLFRIRPRNGLRWVGGRRSKGRGTPDTARKKKQRTIELGGPTALRRLAPGLATRKTKKVRKRQGDHR